MTDQSDKESEGEARRERIKYGRASALGIEMVITTVGGLLLGRAIDDHYNSHNTWTLAGFLLGTSAGFWSLIKFVRFSDKAERGDK